MRSKQANQPHQFFSSEPTTPFCQKQKGSKQNESHQFVDRTTGRHTNVILVNFHPI